MKNSSKVWFWIILVIVAVLAIVLIFRSEPKTNEDQTSNGKFDYEVIEIIQNEMYDEPSEVTIKSLDEWEHYCSDTECTVNFDEKIIAGYNLGMRPNSGYALRVDNVESTEEEIVIHASAIVPGENCITMQVITYPTAYVSMDKTDKPIRWEISSLVEDC
ncbi:MAG TPA: protease complex subunit PrcB family protein [Caldisericia bacterium]|nr:protease complex subunit PrcB family protein [Caldisericia bacterium]